MMTAWDEQQVRDGKPSASTLSKDQREQDQGLSQGSGETVSDPRTEVQVEGKDSKAGRMEELEAQRRGWSG